MRAWVEFSASTYPEFLVLVRDAGSDVDGVHVVREEGIAAVLRNDAERDQDGEAPAIAAGADEVKVAGRMGQLLLDAHRLLDLAELELHGGVVTVAAAVVLGEDVQRLLVPVLHHQVPRRLRDPPDEHDLDYGRQDLQECDRPPRPVVRELRRAPADPGY